MDAEGTIHIVKIYKNKWKKIELLDFQTPVEVSHILLKHTESKNPIVKHTGKAATRTKEEAL